MQHHPYIDIHQICLRWVNTNAQQFHLFVSLKEIQVLKNKHIISLKHIYEHAQCSYYENAF